MGGVCMLASEHEYLTDCTTVAHHTKKLPPLESLPLETTRMWNSHIPLKITFCAEVGISVISASLSRSWPTVYSGPGTSIWCLSEPAGSMAASTILLPANRDACTNLRDRSKHLDAPTASEPQVHKLRWHQVMPTYSTNEQSHNSTQDSSISLWP